MNISFFFSSILRVFLDGMMEDPTESEDLLNGWLQVPVTPVQWHRRHQNPLPRTWAKWGEVFTRQNAPEKSYETLKTPQKMWRDNDELMTCDCKTVGKGFWIIFCELGGCEAKTLRKSCDAVAKVQWWRDGNVLAKLGLATMGNEQNCN